MATWDLTPEQEEALALVASDHRTDEGIRTILAALIAKGPVCATDERIVYSNDEIRQSIADLYDIDPALVTDEIINANFGDDAIYDAYAGERERVVEAVEEKHRL